MSGMCCILSGQGRAEVSVPHSLPKIIELFYQNMNEIYSRNTLTYPDDLSRYFIHVPCNTIQCNSAVIMLTRSLHMFFAFCFCMYQIIV